MVDNIFRPHGIEHLTRAGQALVGIDADKAAIEPVAQTNCADLADGKRGRLRRSLGSRVEQERTIRHRGLAKKMLRFIGRSVSRLPRWSDVAKLLRKLQAGRYAGTTRTSPPISALWNRASSASPSNTCASQAPFFSNRAAPVASVEGRVVRELRRVGKRIAIGVDGDLWLVLHLMIAGRLHWRPPGANWPGETTWLHSTSLMVRLFLPKRVPSAARLCIFSRGRRRCVCIDPGGNRRARERSQDLSRRTHGRESNPQAGSDRSPHSERHRQRLFR